MAVKYVLIFILNSTNPTEQHVAQAWSMLFPSYDECLTQASTIEIRDAILKDCKPMELPGDGPPKDEVLVTPSDRVLEEPDLSKKPAREGSGAETSPKQ
jgi:hypothetical protein